jgi:hypothetical protein
MWISLAYGALRFLADPEAFCGFLGLFGPLGFRGFFGPWGFEPLASPSLEYVTTGAGRGRGRGAGI